MRKLIAILCLLLASPALAQSQPTPSPTAEEQAQAKIAEEQRMVRASTLAGPRRPDCLPDPLNNSIIVCAKDNSGQFRVPSSRGEDETARAGTGGGAPSPPNVFGIGPCTGVCIKGGWAPPPVYYIDVTKLPEPPPGSDADKIAKGEARAP